MDKETTLRFAAGFRATKCPLSAEALLSIGPMVLNQEEMEAFKKFVKGATDEQLRAWILELDAVINQQTE